jgi:pyruvate formate lyase activating enzyme
VETAGFYHVLPGSRALMVAAAAGRPAAKTGVSGPEDFVSRPRLELRPPLYDPESVAALAQRQGCDSVVFGLVEPTYFIETVQQVFEVTRRQNLLALLMTNGVLTRDALVVLRDFVDAVSLSVPTLSDRLAARLSSVPPQVLRQNLKRLHDLGIWVEVRTDLVPGVNDSRRDMQRIVSTIVNVHPSIPWHLQLAGPPPLLGAPVDGSEAIQVALDVAASAGLQNVYAEGAPRRDHELTFCPVCYDEVLVERFMGQPRSRIGATGRCPRCQTRPPGIFRHAAIADC